MTQGNDHDWPLDKSLTYDGGDSESVPTTPSPVAGAGTEMLDVGFDMALDRLSSEQWLSPSLDSDKWPSISSFSSSPLAMQLESFTSSFLDNVDNLNGDEELQSCIFPSPDDMSSIPPELLNYENSQPQSSRSSLQFGEGFAVQRHLDGLERQKPSPPVPNSEFSKSNSGFAGKRHTTSSYSSGYQQKLLPLSDSKGQVDDCRCLHLSAHLLHDLGSKTATTEPTAMDRLLSFFRGSLKRCSKILACDQCVSRTENNMLLAMAARYMSVLCDQIVACYTRRQTEKPVIHDHWSSVPANDRWQSDSSEDIDMSGDLKSEEGHDMWFSTYRIESDQEQTHVLTTLIKIQLTEYALVLEKLRARAGTHSGQLTLVTDAEKRYQKARGVLKASFKAKLDRRV
ncbi:hypothetical protein HJFPF1_08531 [Paramyrothecium foliicola]|nr:hypothetical protein HJFPF1_08531 [Paramyrothecium foliicola]